MLSQDTIIIIAVAGGVGALIFAFATYRLLRSSCFRSAAPLPAPQGLAHHREAASRPTTMYHGSNQSLVAPPLPFASSSQSLPGVNRPFTNRHWSTSTTDEGTMESATSDLTLSQPMQPATNPNPAFNLVSPSSVSVDRLSNDDFSPTTSSNFSHNTTSSSRPLQPRSRSRPRSSVSSSYYGRPASVHSTTNTIRGVPHGPYSNIQIVMPAPLASGLDTASSSRTSLHAGDRRSFVDGWASLPVQTESLPRSQNRRSTSFTEPRTSSSSLDHGSSQTPNVLRSNRRTSSSSSPSTSPRSSTVYPPDVQSAPPVPRIPSIYNTHSVPLLPTQAPDKQRTASAASVTSAPAVVEYHAL